MIAGRNVAGFTRMSVSRGVWGVVLTGVLASGACWLNAADESASAGLRGILPASVPADLTATIDAFPENWKSWGTAVNTELATLYEKEGVDVAGQRKAISALRGRLSTINSHVADPRYRAILNQLVTLSGAIKRRIEVAEAALDTLERGPEARAQRIEAARRLVAQEAQSVDNFLSSVRNGAGWSKYLQVSEMRGVLREGDSGRTEATLASVQSRLKGKTALADAKARAFLDRPQFAAYEAAVDAYRAALAVPAASANSPELRKALADLVSAVEQYEETHGSAASTAARKAFDAVRATAPDSGEALSKALRNNYFNYNVRLVASEGFLNKFVGQSRDEAGPVRDFILGADVYGNQNTHTDVSIDLIPSGSIAQFDIVARGNSATNTEGVTDQATVFTLGNHYFTAAKRIACDGDRFWTQPARISVSANNTTTGADTGIGLPIIGRMANGIAVRRAEEMRGESEAIAASRVQDRVLPPFNTEVDKEFAANGKINPQFAQKMDVLRQQNIYPDAKSWSTTDTELKVAARLMAATELGGSDPSPALVLGRGATILVHESAMNNAADRLELAGKTMTEDELKAKLEGNFSQLLGREVTIKSEKPESEEASAIKTIVFDKADPIRVLVEDGTLTMVLRAGFKQEGKEDIPTQIITVPMTFSVDVKNVVVEPGDVSVAAAERAEAAAKQLAYAGVIKKKISAAFPRREIDRVKYVTHENKKVLVAVTRIRALDGWLSITVE